MFARREPRASSMDVNAITLPGESLVSSLTACIFTPYSRKRSNPMFLIVMS